MGKATVRATLRLLMVLIFLGWISLWLLKPTQLWTRKWQEAEDSVRMTVFGYNGLNFCVYTFPIIALAIIGLIYLDLQSTAPRSRHGGRLTTPLSNPLVVNNYLGVLSAIEIIVVLFFMLFLGWTFYARISNDFKRTMPIKALKLKVWSYKIFRIAVRFGLLAEACLALTLLPILRRMVLFQLLGVQFEASVKYHTWLGTAMLFFATFHGAGTIFIWGIEHNIQDELWRWQRTGRIYLAGEIALVVGLIIWITSLQQIRRKQFRVFYYFHHLYIVFLVFFLLHGGDRHFYMIFPGVFLFGVDKLLRIIQSRPETSIISARIFPCRAVELILPKDRRLKYTPTGTILVKIPTISKFQWHSFSITSSCRVHDDDTMSVIIKSQGWWTDTLFNMIQAELNSDSDQKKCIPIAVEGPYGPASMDFLRFNSLLLIAGGIGITPFPSILQEIVAAPNHSGTRVVTKVQLIYVVKKSEDISLLNTILPLLQKQPASRQHLKVKVFVTQEEQCGVTLTDLLQEFSQMQRVNFDTTCLHYKPQGLERPSLVAALIGFCSVVFLVILCCFNHIFLHPEKKASKRKGPSWVADLLIVCSFIIAITCSSLFAVVLRLRTRRKASPIPLDTRQGKRQEQNLWETKGNLEEHEIYFGGRPDFQDIFSKFSNETGGENVGVLVCGPEKMKASVASLCRLSCQGLVRSKGAEKKPHFSFHPLNFTL